MRWRFWRSEDAAPLPCQEMVELVNDYLEGALEAADVVRFEAHLSACDACSAYIEQIRQSVTMTGRISEDSLDPEIREELLKTFRGWKQAEGV